MKSNFVAKSAPSVETPKSPSSAESSKTTPTKFLLVGRSISLSLLAATPMEEATPTSHAPGLAVPLVLVTVYNPVCMVEFSGSATKMEASCFNMAVSFSLDQTSLCKSSPPPPPPPHSFLSHYIISYIQKYWRELNLVVETKIAIARILADLSLAVQYGIAIRTICE